MPGLTADPAGTVAAAHAALRDATAGPLLALPGGLSATGVIVLRAIADELARTPRTALAVWQPCTWVDHLIAELDDPSEMDAARLRQVLIEAAGGLCADIRAIDIWLARTAVAGAAAAGSGGRCRICGCTDDRACPGGCWWVETDLCSACADQAATTDADAQTAADLADRLVDPRIASGEAA